MDTSTRLISTTTALSMLAHGAAIAMLSSGLEDMEPLVDGVGPGVEIHLVSSVKVAENPESEPESIEREPQAEPVEQKRKQKIPVILAASNRQHTMPRSVKDQPDSTGEPRLIDSSSTAPSEFDSQIEQATNASEQLHSIVELLHSHISDKKEYPYLARRQRREGVATVAFVLHPNGSIEDAHLVKSSDTRSLDRAALSAVMDIEPFSVAQDYLKRSEMFQVDVAFSLL